MRKFEFFVLRYVPSAVRNECVNIGVVLFEPEGSFADVRFVSDWRRVRCLDPQVDLEMLEAIGRGIREQLRDVRDQIVLLATLEESFSNVIQVSPSSGCLAEDPVKELDTLARTHLEEPDDVRGSVRKPYGRQTILQTMREEFESAGVLVLMQRVLAEPYTTPGDPFEFDFGYGAQRMVKLFHAVSVKLSGTPAELLAWKYSQVEAPMRQVKQVMPFLTAVVEDDFPAKFNYAIDGMRASHIHIARVSQMSGIAKQARVDLGLD